MKRTNNLSAVLTCIALVVTTAALGVTPAHADQGDQEVSIGFVPMNLAWYYGRHPDFSDGKIDMVSDFVPGATAAFLFSVSKRWELGPRFTFVAPRLNSGQWLSDMNGLLTARTSIPFAGGDGRWSIGVHGGVNVTRIDAPSGGTSTSTGMTLGPVVGLRVHLASDFWLALDANMDLTLPQGSSEYKQDIMRLSMLSVGIAHRPGPAGSGPPSSPGDQPGNQDSNQDGASTWTGIIEAQTRLAHISLDVVPFLGARYTRQLSGRLALEARLTSIVFLSSAQTGVIFELSRGPLRPYGFARVGTMVGLEDNIEVALSGTAGVGISHTRRSGMYWFLEAGGTAMNWVRNNSDDDVTFDAAHVTAGLGVRR